MLFCSLRLVPPAELIWSFPVVPVTKHEQSYHIKIEIISAANFRPQNMLMVHVVTV